MPYYTTDHCMNILYMPKPLVTQVLLKTLGSKLNWDQMKEKIEGEEIVIRL